MTQCDGVCRYLRGTRVILRNDVTRNPYFFSRCVANVTLKYQTSGRATVGRYCSTVEILVKILLMAPPPEFIHCPKIRSMPTMNEVVVDPEALSGQVTSPISQDTVQNASPSDPTATDEANGAADGCPAVLSGV